ncbi:hypothetical protein I8J29_27410 [Paenibacillus sp. MWE-103]|uniref:Uncharacterized protein n=1 Tax=Paenibacillus artemisiicola TaxID=1172618 RepID=A0ABS3WIG8_9BACL|nr:hypothetical protein [Paenibacillus artemisiicola]MBO7747925.1 hypothetical protein [Paenibacillus artemisiicola]
MTKKIEKAQIEIAEVVAQMGIEVESLGKVLTTTETVEPVTEEGKAEETTSKRKIGKGVLVLKNGEEFASYPSIKATAIAFKEILELKTMPFTPIKKSVREGIDWKEYSFFIEGMGKSANEESETVKTEEAPV